MLRESGSTELTPRTWKRVAVGSWATGQVLLPARSCCRKIRKCQGSLCRRCSIRIKWVSSMGLSRKKRRSTQFLRALITNFKISTRNCRSWNWAKCSMSMGKKMWTNSRSMNTMNLNRNRRPGNLKTNLSDWTALKNRMWKDKSWRMIYMPNTKRPS